VDEKQHINPQVLLRRFAGPGDKLYAYRRDGSGGFDTNVRDIAREGSFYRLEGASDDESRPATAYQ
jgi:hypothetical protein